MRAIYADLNKFDSGAVLLTTIGTRRDLEKYRITLEENLVLTFYMDDVDAQGNPDNLIFSGTVHFDNVNQRWIAEIDKHKIKSTSALSREEKYELGIR